MKTNALLLLALCVGNLLVGCSNDKKSEDPQPKLRAELLMAKTWTITAETQTIGSSTRNVFSGYAACELDNSTQFLAANKLNYDQGAVQCDEEEPRTLAGSWALLEKDTRLSFEIDGFETQAKIEELTENKMVLSETVTVDKQTVITRITFAGK